VDQTLAGEQRHLGVVGEVSWRKNFRHARGTECLSNLVPRSELIGGTEGVADSTTEEATPDPITKFECHKTTVLMVCQIRSFAVIRGRVDISGLAVIY
jgi:hypothetical protein